MADEIQLRWCATQFNDDPPEVDDGCCMDGHATIGRCRLETQTNPKGWVWHLHATGFGLDKITRSGVEDSKEAAKAALEASYRALIAFHPGNRDHVLGHAATMLRKDAFYDFVQKHGLPAAEQDMPRP